MGPRDRPASVLAVCLACVKSVLCGYFTTCSPLTPPLPDVPPLRRRSPYHAGEDTPIRVDEESGGITTFAPAFAGKYSSLGPFQAAGPHTSDDSCIWHLSLYL